jgi:hypothetical protein
MAASIPVLWSDDISVDVLSPLAILRGQTEPLSRMTKGILEAGIETITSDKGKVQHRLDLVAPALNNFHRRILLATHQNDLVYPVVVDAECFLPERVESNWDALIPSFSKIVTVRDPLSEGQRRAATDKEFIELVGQVLRSSQVRSLIQSLIARSNDQIIVSNSSTAETEESPD